MVVLGGPFDPGMGDEVLLEEGEREVGVSSEVGGSEESEGEQGEGE